MNKITTAVIPAGGLGTRFFPLTKTLRKYLLPVYDRPVLDYLIDNCIEAGLTRIIFVAAAGDTHLRHYLGENKDLQMDLTARGKETMYAQLIEPLHKRINFEVIEQPMGGPYGPAAALLQAQHLLDPNQPFVFMMGDDFLWRTDQGSDLADMIAAYHNSPAIAACMVERVATFEALQRNAAVTLAPARGHRFMQDIIEKPVIDSRPRLASIGRYILEHSVFDAIARQPVDERNGELHLSDTLRLLCREAPVLVHVMKGRQLDCGTPENWLKSNNFIAREKKRQKHLDLSRVPR